MKITIVGSGNGGTALAADLTMKGHTITLFKSSESLHNEHFNYLLDNNGKILFKDLNQNTYVNINKVTNKIDEAIEEDTELIILFIQTNYHESIIKKLAPYIKENQAILIEPGYLSTIYFKKYCPEKNIILIEAESSPIDCRITSPGEVQVLFKNVRNPVGVYPVERKDEARKILDSLEYNFEILDSIVEAALHNPNLIVHTVGAIMSIPRIEYTKGDYWMYKEVFTPSVWNLVEQLDFEKMQILKELGLKPIPYVDACKYRNSLDLSVDAKEVFFDYAMNNSPQGPFISNSRYVTEDVPEGLVLLESLGELLNIETPVCSSLINIASACLNQDFRINGRSIKNLGFNLVKEILNLT